MAKITVEDEYGIRVFEGIVTEMTVSNEIEEKPVAVSLGEKPWRENELTGRGTVRVSMAYQKQAITENPPE